MGPGEESRNPKRDGDDERITSLSRFVDHPFLPGFLLYLATILLLDYLVKWTSEGRSEGGLKKIVYVVALAAAQDSFRKRCDGISEETSSYRAGKRGGFWRTRRKNYRAGVGSSNKRYRGNYSGSADKGKGGEKTENCSKNGRTINSNIQSVYHITAGTLFSTVSFTYRDGHGCDNVQ
ncbi:hypothetical protein U1Q18_051084 [Sarracenia purpurea var. burkii]